MKNIVLLIIAGMVIAGCASKQQEPPEVVGTYRPINKADFRPPSTLTPKIFDFKYRGDPERALEALKELQPQLTIIPPTGEKTRQGLIDVDLRQVSLEKTLFEMGKQGGKIYEVVHKNDAANNRDFAYIKYLK